MGGYSERLDGIEKECGMIDPQAYIRRVAEQDADEYRKKVCEPHEPNCGDSQEQSGPATQIFFAKFWLQLAQKVVKSRPRKRFDKFRFLKGKRAEPYCKVVVARDEQHAKELIYTFAQTKIPKTARGFEMGVKYDEFVRRY